MIWLIGLLCLHSAGVSNPLETRDRLLEEFKSGGSVSELERSREILDSLEMLPPDMEIPSAPFYKLASNYREIGDFAQARTYYKKYMKRTKPNSIGSEKATAALTLMDESDKIDAKLGTVEDVRDKRSYRIVKLGNQTWMSENLAWKADSSWCSEDGPVWCERYGRLYDIRSAMTACMPGWRLPLDSEWDALRLCTTIDGDLYGPEFDGGTNRLGFHAVPGGFWFSSGPSYHGIGIRGRYWVNPDTGHTFASYSFEEAGSDVNYGTAARADRLSIRCVLDSPKVSDRLTHGEGIPKSEFQKREFTDPRDKKSYPVVKIGERYWLARNLEYAGKDGSIGSCNEKNAESCRKWGRRYDWSEAMNLSLWFNRHNWGFGDEHVQGICPDGWFLPNRTDWIELAKNTSENPEVAGTSLKSKTGWSQFEELVEVQTNNDTRYEQVKKSGNGTDRWGFAAVPGGLCPEGFTGGEMGQSDCWWSRTDGRQEEAFSARLLHSKTDLKILSRYKDQSLHVRCIR